MADLQHGVVARWQLLAMEFTPRQVRHRIEQARLHPVYRGVYAVGRCRVDRFGRWTAAVLACGRTARNGIPVTALPRTVLDYAQKAKPQQLRLALEAAERQDLLDGHKLDALRARARGHRGQKRLTEVLADFFGPSELERRFLALIRAAGVAEPQANVIVAGEVVDFYWPAARLIVECDGWGFHKTRAVFESDRRKDAKFQLAGCRVLRPTQRRIEGEARQLLGEVIRLLSDAPGAAA